MQKTVTGYALVSQKGMYLDFEQDGDRNIEVHNYHDVEAVDLFDSKIQAEMIMKELINGSSQWNYIIFEKEDYPVKVVKVTKNIIVEEV